MPKKREQIVTVPRQIEVLMLQGKAAPVACREALLDDPAYTTTNRTSRAAEYQSGRMDAVFLCCRRSC